MYEMIIFYYPDCNEMRRFLETKYYEMHEFFSQLFYALQKFIGRASFMRWYALGAHA